VVWPAEQHGGIRVYKTRPLIEGMEKRILLSTFTVTNTNDTGSGSFRDAIQKANSSSGADVINFKIGSGLKTITPRSGLPTLTGPTTVDATTQGGYSGKPIIELRGSSAGGGKMGLMISGGSSTVKGLIINRFSSVGVLLLNKGGNTIKNCWIGVDANGTGDAGNGDKGIIIQSSGNTIGGSSSTDRNIISGNGTHGIQVYTSAASGNKILGNYIGTDYTGTRDLGNSGCGIAVRSAGSNSIGNNTISGNGADGIVINGSGAKNNVMTGNKIGTNAAGTAKIANGHYGIEISEPNNTVGGASSSARNIISGNNYSGVVLWLASGSNNKVIGNYIGTDVTGSKKLGNGWVGVEATNGSSNNQIGGLSSSERNVISGNAQHGVRVYQGSGNRINGNYIGYAANGTSAVGNNGNGIRLIKSGGNSTSGNKIGNNASAAIVSV
jgi:parallel beta-helix repeat protein